MANLFTGAKLKGKPSWQKRPVEIIQDAFTKNNANPGPSLPYRGGNNPREGVAISNQGSNDVRNFANALSNNILNALATGNNPNEHAGVTNQDKLNQYLAAVNGNSPSGSGIRSGGSGASNGAAGPKDPLINPFELPYDQLIKLVQSRQAPSLANLDSLKQSVAENYRMASQSVYDQYNNSANDTAQQANALGAELVPYMNDPTMRRVKENADQASAVDQSWFDKMKALKGDQFDSLYVGLNREKVQQMALWQIAQAERDAATQAALRKGSGGSGRRGYGGSGSSSGAITNTEKATETTSVTDPYFMETYQGLLTQDPQAAAQYWAAHNRTLGGDVGALQTELDRLNATPSFKPKAVNPSADKLLAPFGADSSVRKQANTAAAGVFNTLLKASKNSTNKALLTALGVPNTKRTVTTTGSTKKKTDS